MRIRYYAEATGPVVESAQEEFKYRGFSVQLHFGEENIEGVSVERELTEEEQDNLINKLEKTKEGTHSIEISGTDKIREDAIDILQTFESFGGLHGLEEIRWQEAETEFIPESENEIDKVGILKAQFQKSYPISSKRWTFDLTDLDWDHVGELKLPLAFYRRGNKFFNQFDYILATIHFYFIIEGFYSNGNHQNVDKEYLQSDELMNAVSTTFPDLMDTRRIELEPFFDFYNQDMNPEGFVRLFTIVRHQLHHYFHEHKSPHKPNPYQSEDFEPIAFGLLHLTVYILLCKINKIEITGQKKGVIEAPILESLGIEFDRESLDLINTGEGKILTTEGAGSFEVVCERCGETIAENFDWESVSNLYTVCPGCGGTLQLGGLG